MAVLEFKLGKYYKDGVEIDLATFNSLLEEINNSSGLPSDEDFRTDSTGIIIDGKIEISADENTEDLTFRVTNSEDSKVSVYALKNASLDNESEPVYLATENQFNTLDASVKDYEGKISNLEKQVGDINTILENVLNVY